MNRESVESIRIGEFNFDPARGALLRDGAPVAMSDSARNVLAQVAARPGEAISVSELCAATGLDAEAVEGASHELSLHLGNRLDYDSAKRTLTLAGNDSLFGLLEELRNRKVFRVATGYAVTGWLLLQVAEIVFPLIGFGEAAMQALLVSILVGFPVAVAAAWALELTPAGLVLDWRRRRPDRVAAFDERKLDRFVIAALVMVIAILLVRMWDGREDAKTPDRVVAVLPFQSAANESDLININLCTGFAEEIRVGLDRLPGIQVVARDMNAGLGQSEARSGIEWLVQGRCQRKGDALNVNVSLIETASGKERWTYSDSRTLDELLSMQDDIAATLAMELAVPEAVVQAVGDAETSDPRAYRLYLQARGYLSRPPQANSLETAADLFRQALVQDEEFAAAHAGLCEANLDRYFRTHEVALARQAESACLRASQLGPGLPQVHIALGRLFLETGDYGAAERALRRALELKPGSAVGTRELANVFAAQNRPAQAEALFRDAIALPAASWRAYNDFGGFLLRRGRFEEAAIQFEEAVALTPDNAPVFSNLGATYMQLGRFADAALSFERVAEINPRPSSVSNYGTMLYFAGRFEEAEAQFRRAADMAPADHRLRGNVADALYHIEGRRSDAVAEYRRALALARERQAVSRKDPQAIVGQAWYSVRQGDDASAAALRDEALQMAPDNPENLYYAALVSLELGDAALALQQLEQAAAAGYPSFMIAGSPDLEPLSDLPGFAKLAKTTPDAE